MFIHQQLMRSYAELDFEFLVVSMLEGWDHFEPYCNILDIEKAIAEMFK
jgi:hypothetical protein